MERRSCAEATTASAAALPLSAGEQADGDEDQSATGGWVSLKVASGTRIDLLALPSAAQSGLQLARGELAPGSYGNLRIRYDEATITFALDVSVGGGPMAKTYAAGQPYPLQIGGGKIRIPTSGFTVAEDAGETVVITFDGSATVRTVVATPVGVRMAPVLSAAAGGGEERGGGGRGRGRG